MRFTTALRAATVALAVLAITGPTVAQEDPGSPPGLDRVLRSDPLIADLDFDGGSLEAFVRSLRKAAGDSPVNIVFGPEAAGIPVPPIELQHVDVFMALRSVSQASNSLVERDPELNPFVWGVDRISGDGSPVYTIEVHELGGGRSSGPGSPPSAQLHTAVHSIANLTSGPGAMSADDVLAAIQLGLEMDGKNGAKLSFHEETGLLFARVNHDQANAIEMTIVHLRQSMSARQRSESISQLDRVFEATDTRTVDELVERVRGTAALRQQVADLQRTVRDLERMLDTLKAELAEARRQ